MSVRELHPGGSDFGAMIAALDAADLPTEARLAPTIPPPRHPPMKAKIGRRTKRTTGGRRIG